MGSIWDKYMGLGRILKDLEGSARDVSPEGVRLSQKFKAEVMKRVTEEILRQTLRNHPDLHLYEEDHVLNTPYAQTLYMEETGRTSVRYGGENHIFSVIGQSRSESVSPFFAQIFGANINGIAGNMFRSFRFIDQVFPGESCQGIVFADFSQCNKRIDAKKDREFRKQLSDKQYALSQTTYDGQRRACMHPNILQLEDKFKGRIHIVDFKPYMIGFNQLLEKVFEYHEEK